MNWRLAKSLVRLREQINAAYPNRDKSSDGSVGDLRHKKSKSDHNPNSAGVVTAIDIDEDIAPGATVAGIVAALQASGDTRIKYLIYESRITVKGDIRRWKPYTGANAHKHHVHISVSSDPKLYDNNKDWNIDPAAHPSETQPNGNVSDSRSYTVQPGDTLWRIAGHFGTTVAALKQANPSIKDADIIKPGMKLRVKL